MNMISSLSDLQRKSTFKLNNIVVLLLLLIGFVVFFSFQSPFFLSKLNLFNILIQVTTIGLIAIPMTFIIISGAMDLSVGSILGISAITLGVSFQYGTSIWISVLLA